MRFVPTPVAPPRPADIAALARFLKAHAPSVAAITGAGVSTAAGIPDYRSPEGSYSKGHVPMQHADFVRSERKRKRFWARSVRGFRYFSQREPSAAHRLMARLEAGGVISGLVTQNVDRLHHAAGHANVVELHGRGDAVRCLNCGHTEARVAWTENLARINHDWVERHGIKEFRDNDRGNEDDDIRADGDSHLVAADFDSFEVPHCSQCGHGVVMPDLVFFGGSIRNEVKEAAAAIVDDADALLIVGSSCMTYSCFRLVRAASTAGKPIAMVNLGETRVDDMVDLKVEGVIDDVLAQAAVGAGF